MSKEDKNRRRPRARDKPHQLRRALIEELEPRILLSTLTLDDAALAAATQGAVAAEQQLVDDAAALAESAAAQASAPPDDGAGAEPAAEAAPPNDAPQREDGSADSTRAVSGQTPALPLAFEENLGEHDPAVDFSARGTSYRLFLGSADAVIAFESENSSYALRLDLVGGNEAAAVSGEGLLANQSSSAVGDESQGRTGVESFGAVRYAGVYDDIDIRYHGNQHSLECEFVVAPSADPAQIRLRFEGADSVQIDAESGDLIVALGESSVRLKALASHQVAADGTLAAVESAYMIHADGSIGLALGPYDAARELVVESGLDGAAPLAPAESTPATLRRELVILDPGVQNSAALRDLLAAQQEAGRELELFVLDADRDGIQQIAEILASRRELDAVHVLSHGSAEGLQLGSTLLDRETIDDYADVIRGWQTAFSADADLLLYGCDLAASDAGRSLVDTLGQWTGADVAASTDLTGTYYLGGDWDLEYRAGRIETAVAAGLEVQRDWLGLMNVNVDATSTGTTTGTSLTISHATSGTNRLMIVGVSIRETGTESVSSVTYKGDLLTFRGFVKGPTGARVEIWSLVAPSSGNHNVVINLTGAGGGTTAGVTTFTGVDQANALGTFASASGDATSGAASVASAPGDLVFGVIAVKDSDQDLIPGAGQTERWDLFTGTEANGGASTEAGAASVNLSWTWSAGTDWAIGAVSIKPAAFVVTNTNNTGAGSLRQAILDANAAPGADVITFSITGAGVQTIAPNSALPTIDGSVTIDATTQPGFAGTPLIRLDGASAGAGVDGLSLSSNSDDSTIRGLMITRFTRDGIAVQAGADNITIAGNWIGTTGTGSTGVGNADDGIDIAGSLAVIGGTDANDRNVITNSGDDGIDIVGSGVTGHRIQGNYIGLDPDGSSGGGNADVGIAIISGSGNTIGGTSTAARNVISKNSEGIEINTSNNVVQGNYIGTDATGTLNRGQRSDDGVEIKGSATGNVIGGTAAGAGNLIAFNFLNGVSVVSGSGQQILGNTIHSNGQLGIDLGGDGRTSNDAGDVDAGGNDLQNFPVLTSANSNAAGTTIVGSLNSTANTTFRIELFANRPAIADATNGEAERYLGFVTVTTDGSGNATLNTTLANVWVNSGDRITAAATVDFGGGSYGSTSEFAANVSATSTGIIVVDTTSDVMDGTTTSITNLGNARGADGRISLREAIAAANSTANGPSTDKIVFDIPLTDVNHVYYRNNSVAGTFAAPVATTLADSAITDFDADYVTGTARSWYRITLGTTSLDVTQAVIIDGSTQAGYDAAKGPVIEVNAAAVTGGDANAIALTTGGSTIRGLVINRAGDNAIEIDTGATASVIVGNYIGTDVSGTQALGNSTVGSWGAIAIKSNNVVVGGTAAADRNLISGNLGYGIEFYNSASNALVQGNYIGTTVTGSGSLGNSAAGVFIRASAANNMIGGTGANEGNLIASNGADGIWVDATAGTGNAVLGNSIYANTGLGVDLGANGATANDLGDADTGANNLQNFPVLFAASSTGGNTSISGSLNSIASTTFRIEFFSAPTGDASGYGEGQVYLGATTVTTDAAGNANFATTLAGVSVATGHAVSATATVDLGGGNYGSTSEFAANLLANNSANVGADRDTYLKLKDPTLNYGTATSLVIDRETTDLQRALLNFDLSAIPANATITGATLTMQATQVGGSLTISVYEMLQAWVEGSGNGGGDAANWSQSSPGTSWASEGGDFNATAVASLTTNATGQHSWNLTTLVQAWVSGTKTNNGLMVASPDGGGNRTATYDSSEGATPPQLVISYTVSANTAPVLNVSGTPVLGAIAEDAGAPVGAVGTRVSSLVDFAAPAGQVDNVTDSDAGAQLGIAVTGADSANGTWWYSTNDGSNWNSLGVVSNANARLLAADASTRLYFQPNANYNGTLASAITFRAWDRTSGVNGLQADASITGAATAFSTASDSASLVISAVNDAPSATNLSAAETYTEDTPLNLTDIVISDVDSADVRAVLTLSNPAAGGLNTATSGAVTSTYNAGSGVWLASGALADVNSLLAGLTFTPALNFNGSFSISTSVDDGFAAPITGSKAMTGTPLNDAPTLGNGTLSAVNEDTAGPAGQTVSGIFTGQFADIDAGSSFGGVAVVANTANAGTQGTWQYSTNAGGNWFAIGTVADGATALAVSSTTLVRFVPVANYNGTPPALGVRGLDNSYAGGFSTTSGSETRVSVNTTTSGGTSAIAAVSANLATSILAVNDAPIRTAGSVANLTVSEDSGFTTLGFGGVAFSPGGGSDESGQSLSYSVSAIPLGSIGDVFLADGTTQVTVGVYSLAQIQAMQFKSAANASGVTSFQFDVTDSGGTANGGANSLAQFILITVNAVNDAPVHTVPGAQNMNEDAALVFSLANGNPISISDVDAGASIVNALVSVSSGTLTLSGIGGLTFISGDGSDDALINVTGTIANINAALNGLTFTPSPDFSGGVTLQLITGDMGNSGSGGALADTDTVSISVNALNDPPVITSATLTVSEGQTATLSSANFGITDPDDSSFTYSVSAVTGGYFQLSSAAGIPIADFASADLDAGLVQFVDDGDESAPGFSVAVSDGAVDSNTLAASVTYTPVNDAPLANDDAATLSEGASGTFSLAGNDSDADDALDLTSIQIVSGPANGSVVVNADGTVSYTHNGSETTSDGFTYTIRDASGAVSNVATVSLTVTVVNDAPVANNDSAALNEGASSTINLAANDSDADSAFDFASIQIVSGPAIGGVVVNGDGTVTYTHNGGETVADTFTYTIRDASGAISNVATVTLTVNAVNDAPVASDDSATLAEGASSTFSLAANDSDADNALDLTSIQIVSGPASGSVVVNADGTVNYTHDGSETTADAFTYTIRDASGAISNVATVTLTVNAANDAPVASNDAGSANEAGATTVDLAANDSDADNALDLTSIQIVSGPANGSVIVNADGTVSYTHNGSETTADGFTYTIRDASGAVSNVATVTLTVNPVNDAPVASSDAGSANEGAATTIDLAANDSDADSALDLASIQIISGPASGSVVVNGDGTVTYTHDGSETASDSFTYTIKDASGAASNVATVTLSVNALNDAPVANADAGAINEGGAGTIDLAANDSDADSALDLTSIQIASGPANGSVIVNADGTVSYTHNGSETAADAFTYTIRDASGAISNVATVTLTVNPVNDAPAANADAATLSEGGSSTIDLAANDSDFDSALDLTSIQIVSGPASGSFIVNADGTVSYTHNGSETTADAFTYTIRDASGAISNVATVSLTVNAVNDAPVAVSDSAALAEGASSTFSLAANDTDTDNALDLTSIQIVSGPANGSVVVNADGTVTYTHDGSETAADALTYTIRDASGAISNVATVTLTVNPVNDAPVANNDAATLSEGASSTIDLAVNDSDADSALDLASIQIVSGPANGSVAVNADGTVTYTHDGSETTADAFTYTIRDASGAASNVATVTLSVNPVNDAPVANNDAATLSEGASSTFSLAGNDSDADNALDLTSIQVVSGPANGSVIVNADGTVTYTHDGSETTADAFTYTIRDASGAISNIATVTLTVNPVNDLPVANADAGTANEGGATTINLAANDSDTDNALDLTSIQIVSGPASGSVVVNGDGTVSYTHDGSETTADAFTYTIRDASGAISNVATVTLTVNPVNDAPAASDDAATLSEGMSSTIDLATNDSDADNALDLTSIQIVSGPASGSVVVNADGSVTYTHDGSETTADAFTYTIRDASGAVSNVATVTLTVNLVNDAPVASDDSGTANEGGSSTIDLAANDGDPDSALDLTSIQIVSGPANGSVVVNGDGTVSYTHDGSETTADAFTYTIRDASGAISNVATVTLTVNPVNDAPVAIDDAATLNEGGAGAIDLAANDTDADSALDLTSIQVVSGPANGSVVVNGDGTVTYTHNGSETAADAFTYTIRDASGAISNVATVTLTVNPVNDAPVASNDAATLGEGAASTINLAANDSDTDNALDLTSIQIVSGPANGSVVVNGDGTVSYTHDGSEATADAFTYTIRDASGAISNVATLTLTVNPVNDAPVASNDAASLNEGANSTIDLAANDSDADSALDLTSIQIVSGPANGSVVVNGDGTVSYTHNGSETTADAFTYTIRDASGAISNVATVTLTVNPVNDAPVANSDAATLSEGASSTIDLAANDTDGDDALDLTSIQIVSGPANGSVVVNADGTVSYTHNGSETAADAFTYTIRDASGAISNVATVTLTVNPMNDAPVASDDAGAVNEGGAGTIDLGANDTDFDNALDLTSIQIVSGPASGSVVVNADGTVSYTHNGSETAADAFTYTIRDASGAISNVATVTLTVNPVNDAPAANADASAVNEGGASSIDLAANDSDTDNALDLTSIQIVSGPANGSVVVNADGTVSYTHNGSETTSDAFSYTIRDASGAISNVATVTLTVNASNDAPVANNDNATLNEGASSTIDLAANDADADDVLDLTSIQIVSGPANGSVLVNADGTVTYTHNGSETAADAFTYTIRDASGAISNVATVTLTVNPVNDAPVASDDAGAVNEGGAGTIDLGANDTDFDNALDLTSIQIVSGPASGSVVVNADGTVTYTHNGSETAADAFTYTIRDASGAISNFATVTLTVNPVNDAPVASADAGTVNEGGATTIDLAANDTDADNALDLTSIQIVSGPASGSVVVNADGTVTYTHDGSETTADAFTYTIRDASGAISNFATVTLTVNPVNDAPVASDDAGAVNEGGASTIDLAANDTDADNALDLTSIQIVAGPASGSVVVSADGTVTYTHDGSETAADAFTYTIRDASGAISNVATVMLTVNPMNDAPVANADAGTVNEGGAATIDLAANDTDADNALDLTSIQLVSGPANGSVVVNADGTVSYTQNGTETTADAFTYTIRDASGAISSVAMVTLTVSPVNDLPSLLANTLSITRGGVLVLSPAEIAGSDDETAASALTFTISGISHGSFERVGAPGVAISSFTQAQLAAGQIRFVHDGTNSAPTYSLSVGDGTSTVGPFAAAITLDLGGPPLDPQDVPGAVDDTSDDSTGGPGDSGPGGSGDGAPGDGDAIDGVSGPGNVSLSLAFETEHSGIAHFVSRAGGVHQAKLVEIVRRAELGLAELPEADRRMVELMHTTAIRAHAALWASLDRLRNELAERELEATALADWRINAIELVALAFSSGFLLTMLRSSSLWAAALSSLPLWRRLDPLVVLAIDEDQRRRLRAELRRASAEEDRRRVGRVLDADDEDTAAGPGGNAGPEPEPSR